MAQNHMQTVLIVDPEADFVQWATSQLTAPSVKVCAADNPQKALELYDTLRPDLVLTELRLVPFDGLQLLSRLREKDPNATVLVTSEYSTNQAVIEAMKLGAFDFVRKEMLPFNLKIVVDAALKSHAELKAARHLKQDFPVEFQNESIIGSSEALQNVFKIIGRVAGSDVPVMITGESGSGKELVARAIHRHSGREGRPFVAINCAAIPENLLESELFGHEKGSFTGAVSQRVGRFEQCDQGTLFLDEIGEMPMPLQSKILRVLQDGEFSRVGGNESLRTRARILAATNRNLEEEVAQRHFREDLFYRLNVVRIHLPPLRERRDDIRLLSEYFLQKIAKETRAPRLRLSQEAVEMLVDYHWPGNVRELENTMQRATILATTEVLLPKDIPLGSSARLDGSIGSSVSLPVNGGGGRNGEDSSSVYAAYRHPYGESDSGAAAMASDADDPSGEGQESGGYVNGKPSVEEAIQVLLEKAENEPDTQLLPWLEREFTRYAMEKTGGNQVRSAQLLGVTRATLRKRIERFGITKELRVR